jgi:hypothetical protein
VQELHRGHAHRGEYGAFRGGMSLAMPTTVTMLRLKPRQLAALGETLRALANLVVTALVLSQVVARQSVSVWLIAAGVSSWIGFVWLALWLIGEE